MVGFHRGKNKSSLHRRGVHEGTYKEGFRRRSKKGDFGRSKLSGLGSLLSVCIHLRGREFFLLGLFSIFGPGKEGFLFKGLFSEEKLVFFGFCSMFLCLGEP